MPRLSSLLFVLAGILQACATPRSASTSKPPSLEVDFELMDGHLDRRGYVRGRLMIYIVSGAAQLLRDFDPVLNVAGDVYECSHGTKVFVPAVDHVIRKEAPTVVIDDGYWFGHDYSEGLFPPGAVVPECIEGVFAVGATDASEERVLKVAKKKLRLLRRDE